MKLDTVLVPLDGSTLAETALPAARELARPAGARLLLVRATQAAPTWPGADPVDLQVAVVREAEEYLTRVADRLRAEGFREVETSVWYGPAAFAIVEAARFHKVGLIVMTSHGRSGLGRLILGSVAESVLRGTTTPILLLRDGAAPVETPAEPARPWSMVPTP